MYDSERVNSAAADVTGLQLQRAVNICLDCMTACETPKYVHICWYLCACTIHCGTQRRWLNPPSRLLSAGGKREKGCRKESTESNIITARGGHICRLHFMLCVTKGAASHQVCYFIFQRGHKAQIPRSTFFWKSPASDWQCTTKTPQRNPVLIFCFVNLKKTRFLIKAVQNVLISALRGFLWCKQESRSPLGALALRNSLASFRCWHLHLKYLHFSSVMTCADNLDANQASNTFKL